MVEQSPFPLHIVPVTRTSVEGGVYLCTSPHTRAQLDSLLRSAEHTDRWDGVVFCEHIGVNSEIPADMLESWGDHAMQIGELLFFGDPSLLGQIRDTALQGQRR